MALNPLIALQSKPLDVGQTFNTLLTNIGNLDAIRQNREQAPIRNQLLEQQLLAQQNQQAQAPTRQQILEQQAAAGAETNFQNRQKNRLASVASFAQEILPFLNRDDPETALQLGYRRKAQIEAEQKANPNAQIDTAEVDDLITMLESKDPEQQLQATRLADSAVQSARQSGLLNKDLTPRQRELREFAALPTNTPQEQEFKKQFGTAIGAIAKTQTIDERLRLARLKGSQETTEAGIKTTQNIRIRRIAEMRKENQIAQSTANSSTRRAKEALILVDKAASGLAGTAKLKLAKIFPDIDVSDEGALMSSFRSLALDELAKFKGPTTDFEFNIAESITGVFGDPRTANKARLNGVLRAAWFTGRNNDQFRRHMKDGGEPDDFNFNFDEQINTKKGAFSLQDLQDTAVHGNISIEEVLRRLNQ